MTFLLLIAVGTAFMPSTLYHTNLIDRRDKSHPYEIGKGNYYDLYSL